MLKKILRIISSIILLVFLILTIIHVSKGNTSKSDGTITVIVNTKENEIVSKKRLEYKKGDTLYKIINDNYKIDCDNTSYGHYLLSISDDNFSIKTNGDTSGWLWFELLYLKEGYTYTKDINFEDYNKIDVTQGIDNIELKDNMILGINERDNNHESSIFLNNINLSNTNKNNNILKIILIVLIIVILISLIIYSLIKMLKSNNKPSVKQICILSFMTVILFVQEQLLTFIPNVQLTFLLIAVYTKVFGFKNTSIIILVHVILDNLIMGSFTPIIVLPMFIGYFLTSFLVELVKNKNLIIKIILTSLGSLIYCYLFLVTNALFLDINIYIYWISDIPFEILLIISTILTMTYLYNPLVKLLTNEYNNQKEMEDFN